MAVIGKVCSPCPDTMLNRRPGQSLGIAVSSCCTAKSHLPCEERAAAAVPARSAALHSDIWDASYVLAVRLRRTRAHCCTADLMPSTLAGTAGWQAGRALEASRCHSSAGPRLTAPLSWVCEQASRQTSWRFRCGKICSVSTASDSSRKGDWAAGAKAGTCSHCAVLLLNMTISAPGRGQLLNNDRVALKHCRLLQQMTRSTASLP